MIGNIVRVRLQLPSLVTENNALACARASIGGTSVCRPVPAVSVSWRWPVGLTALRRLADSSPRLVSTAFFAADADKDRFECLTAERLPCGIAGGHSSCRAIDDKAISHTKDLMACG